jgi:Concanavalin A-like lectin/glucanases superfamily
VSLLKAGAQAALKVQLTKSNGFDDKVTLAVEGLPEGVTAKAAAIEKGQTEVALELAAAQAIPPGNHAVSIVGSATFQNQPQKFVLDKVSLIGPPIAIAFAPAGAVRVGGKQTGVLKFAGDVQPVAAPAVYQSGVTRGVDGPRAPALAGFEADNKAAGFSGVDKGPGDDRLTAELPAPARGDYTIEMWLFNERDLTQPNSPAISGYVFSRPGTASAANAQPGDHLGIGGVESSPRDKLFFYDGQTLVPGRTTLSIGAWHHVALVRSGDEVKVYLDGDANPEIAAKAPKSFDACRIVLGTRADGFAPFKGRLDEVAFFDAALSPAQIQAHFAAAKAKTPARDVVLKDNPLAYWKLDETEGQTAASVAPPHKRLVKLAWQNLPAGLTAPTEVVLLDAQNQVEIELAAAASVPPGKLEKVVVSGTTPAGGSEFTAESTAVDIEVTKP